MAVVFVAKESIPGETRVAVCSETVHRMVQKGHEVLVQAGAGSGAFMSDSDFTGAGASIVEDFATGLARADIVLKVAAPSAEEARQFRKGQTLVSFLQPAQRLDVVRALAESGTTVFAMDLVPRITRAQKMDALSSQANIAGYKAVLLAASNLGRYFPLLMTAAGTVKPAKVVVFGAGVAGLYAIATARRLGAVVWATDIRPVVKEQVESLGGHFIEVEADQDTEDQGGYAKEASEDYKRRQQAAVAEHVSSADVVITTAQVPGKRAPVLVTRAMVESMRAGSVIVDIAAGQGGNCECTEAGKHVRVAGVLIIGETNLPATVPVDASVLYSRNVLQVVEHLTPEKDLKLDFEDEITAGSVAIHEGEIRHAPTAQALQSEAQQ